MDLGLTRAADSGLSGMSRAASARCASFSSVGTGRIVTVLGSSIGWYEALLRDSVGIAFGVISTVATLIGFLRVPESSWSHHWMQQAKLLHDARPAWGRAAGTAAAVWSWSELVVLLLNRRRRALHDFIAGTVVIRKGQPSGSSS